MYIMITSFQAIFCVFKTIHDQPLTSPWLSDILVLYLKKSVSSRFCMVQD